MLALSATVRAWKDALEARLARAAPFEGAGVPAVAPVDATLRRAALVAFLALGFHALVWLLLPASTVHPDSLDELLAIEKGWHAPNSKHPADMPLLGLVWSGLQALGYAGRAIRPVQVWNGCWMTVALAGVLFFARRSQGRWTPVGAGVAALLAGMQASLHLALDPHNTYVPPGLALMTWGLALSLAPRRGAHGDRRERLEWAGSSACLVGAVLFDPMVAIACPLAAVAWCARARAAGRPMLGTRGAVVAGLVPLVLPLATLLAFLVALSVERQVIGPYGRWSAVNGQLAWNAVRNAVLSHRGSFAPVLAGERSAFAFLLTAAYGGLAVAGVAGAMLVVASRAAAARFLPYGLAALTVALFVGWWGPGNFVFWVLPVWLAGLGLVRAAGEGTARAARRAGAVLVLEALLVCAVNGVTAWKEAHAPNRQERRALRIAERVAPADTVVHLGWKSPALAYYTQVRCRGILSFHCFRADGVSTLELLERELRATRQRGGVLWLETPRPGQPWVSPQLAALLRERDFDAADFERMPLGRELAVDGTVFREVLALAPSR